ERARPDRGDAIENEAARGSVHEINYVIELAAKGVDVFAIEGGNERLIELRKDAVRDFVAFMLNILDGLYLFGDTGIVRKQFHKGARPFFDVLRLFNEKLKEILFARHEPLQKSWHVL